MHAKQLLYVHKYTTFILQKVFFFTFVYKWSMFVKSNDLLFIMWK